MSSGTRPPKSVTHAPAQKPRPAPPKPRPRVPAGVAAGGERGWASAPAPPFGIAGPALFQRKLVIGAPDDAFEREADQVADQVAGGGPTTPPRITPVTPTALAPAVRREMEEDEGRVQRATAGDRTAHDDEPPPVHAEAPPPAPVAPPPPPPPVPHAATDEMRKADAPAPVVQRATAGDVTAHDHEDRDPRYRSSLPVQRATKEWDEDDGKVRTERADGGPAMRDAAARAIATRGPGAPLIPTVRETLQSRLGVELGGVRVHTGPDAERATGALRARAFTHGADIWLGRGESAADTRLVAHEVAHVVQQGAAAPRPAAPAPAAASPAPGRVQRLGIPDWLLERAEGYARQLPGWTLFTVIIGYNPLLRRNVDRTAVNLVGGFMGLVPFGTAIFDKLNEYGIIQGAFDWVQAELRRLDLSLGRLERTLDAAWADVHLTEGFDYNYRVLERHFGALYDDVVAFATSLVDHVIQLIKDAAVAVAERLLAENHAWALIKKILGHDPLRDVPVQATPTEILSDFLLLIGKEEHLRQMRERGTLEETANWIATQIGAFLTLLSELRGLVTRAWDAIQPSNIANLMDNLRSLAADAGGFLQRVWDFATTVAAKVLELVKKSLLGWLASVAEETPGFHLVTVILGRNPFTGERVPPTAENLIRGFITLLPNGQAIYARLAESGTVARAAARIQGAVEELGISWDFIVGIFTGIWESLSIEDLIHPVDAFMRIVGEFGEPISRLFRFVGVVLREMITIILEIMNFPSDLIGSIVANAMAAIEDIKRDPVGFLLHMIAALKRGFSNFFAHIVTHLAGGLADWLFRGLRQAGLEPPRDLSLGSVLDFVLQVLGITVDRLWQKLGERIGPERVAMIRGALDRLTGIIAFVRDVQQRGIAAVWEYIESQISGLWDMVLQKAKDWIMERIINRAIQWLLSLLDVTGIMPVINSAMAFFRAVQSAIDYLRDILAIINDYVTTIAAVARGEIEPGAQKVELGLAHAVPVAIGFLANQFGLGNIGEKITEIVGGIREVVDHALDWLIDRAVTGVQSLLASLGGGRDEVHEDDPEKEARVRAGLAAIDTAEQAVVEGGELSHEEAVRVAASVKRDHPVFTSLEVVDGGDSWDYRWTASPGGTKQTPAKKEEVLYVSVHDSQPPGRSAIGALPAASPGLLAGSDRSDAPAVFEQEVGRALAASQGLNAPVPNARDRWPARTRTATGLPPSPQLLQQPKTNLGGVARADDIHRRPDWAVLSPGGAQQVEAFEVTLDSNFRIPEGGREATAGAEPHKRVQVAATVFAIAQRYPNAPIIYNIRATREPSDEVKRYLETELKAARRSGIDVQIIWRTG